MVTPSAAVGGATCLTAPGLARNRCPEVPYREDGGGAEEALLKRKKGSGGAHFQMSDCLPDYN